MVKGNCFKRKLCTKIQDAVEVYRLYTLLLLLRILKDTTNSRGYIHQVTPKKINYSQNQTLFSLHKVLAPQNFHMFLSLQMFHTCTKELHSIPCFENNFVYTCTPYLQKLIIIMCPFCTKLKQGLEDFFFWEVTQPPGGY